MKLDTPESIEKFGFDLQSLHMKYDRWLQTTVTQIVDEEVIEPIINSMLSHNYSQKIIDGVGIEVIIRKGNKITIRVVSRYKTNDGFDVAKAVEEGTVAHWIEPLKFPTSLRDTNTGVTSEHPTAQQEKDVGKKALHWTSSWGEEFFSKGHVVGGIPARKLVKYAVEHGRQKVKERVKEAFKSWRNDVLSI